MLGVQKVLKKRHVGQIELAVLSGHLDINLIEHHRGARAAGALSFDPKKSALFLAKRERAHLHERNVILAN